MDLRQRLSQMLQLMAAIVICVPVTTAQLVAAFPALVHPAFMRVGSFPVFATQASHPLQIGGSVLAQGSDGTEALIGSFGGGTIVATQLSVHSPLQLIVHQSVPYTTATGEPIVTPLKLFFTRFPPLIEGIVQRIQNYFSTYNYVDNENYPASTQENKPLSTTTTSTTPASTSISTTEKTLVPESPTTTEKPTVTTLQPISTNVGSQTGNDPYDEHTSSIPPFVAPERIYRHRYDPVAFSFFKYPYPKTGSRGSTSKYFSSVEV